MSNIFDTHCHPQFPHYDKDREQILARANESGVKMICVGTDLNMSKEAIKLSEEHKNIWATVGAHPNDINDIVMDDFVHMMNEKMVVAIGEVGLDYYRTVDKEKQKEQRGVFEQFINLAYQYQKPLVIHCRNAHKDAIDVLKSARDILCGGVIHSFTGTLDEAKEYLELGFYLGFNGIITFARQYDETVIYTPLERIFLETDAPYLTPEPYRGKRNEPAYVIEVAKQIGKIKNLLFDRIINVTTQNTVDLFKISL